MAVSHIKSDTIPDFTGTFTGFNSQGLSTTMAATDLVRPSDWNSVHNQFYTLSGNTFSNSTASGTNVQFQGAGMVSLGGSADTIIFNASQSNPGFSAGGGSSSFQTLSFSNANGISFSNNAGQVQASYTVPSQTVQTQASGSIVGAGFTSAGANVGISGTNDSAGLSLSITAAAQSVQTQASGGIAGTATANTGGAAFTLNSGGLSFNGASLAGVSTAVTGNASFTVNSSGVNFNLSNLAGTATAITGNASITLNTTGLSFNGSGLAGTATAITGKALITMNSAGFSFNGTSLAGVGTSVASTTGNYSMVLNSTGLTLSVPYLTRYIWPEGNLVALTAPGNASLSIQYMPIMAPMTGTRLDALIAMSAGSTASAVTAALAFSAYAIIYTRNAATLSSLSSGSTQTTYSYASNSAGQTQLTNSNIRAFSVPINFNMAPGEYYVGFNLVTAASSIGAATTAAGLTMSMMGGNQIQTALNYADITANTATSVGLYGAMGIHSVATTGVVTRLSISDINQTGSALSAANIALVFRNA